MGSKNYYGKREINSKNLSNLWRIVSKTQGSIMINKLSLGIVTYNGKIVNHRSIIKVLLNPFLRLIGIEIATNYLSKLNKLSYPVIQRCNKKKKLKFIYTFDEGYKIDRKRMFI